MLRSRFAPPLPVRRLSSTLCLASLAFAPTANAAEIEATGGGPGAATPWTSLAANDDESDFHFVIVSDRTGGERPGVFESALPKANLLEPAFVVSVGDLIEGYTEDQQQLDREWDEFEGFVDGIEAPFFYVAGNHDMNNAVMAETWRHRFGPSYYRFAYKDVLFLVLNSELFGMVGRPGVPVPGPWTQAEQLDFIDATLREFPNPRWTIVLVHQPLWDYGGARGDWPKVETMLADRDYTVFAGHFHRYVKLVRDDRRYITLATTGGGSSLRGPLYGEFDHIAWVSMTAAGPRIANLELDGILGEDLVTEAKRAAIGAMSSAVRSVPLLGSGRAFDSGVVAYEIRNPGTAPMQVTYHVDPGPDLRYAGTAGRRSVAPGEAVRVDLALTAPAPVPYAGLRPGRVLWSLTTQTSQGPLRLETSSGLLPVAPLRLPSGTAPELDGSLDDWPSLPFEAKRQGDAPSPATTPTDISFRFGLREVDGDIYFAAEVTDDSVFASGSRLAEAQDAVLLVVDSRSGPERSVNLPLYNSARDGHLRRMALAHLTVADAKPAPVVDYLPPSQAGMDWRAQRTATGYAVEARVPGAFLDAQADGRWQTVRVAVAAVDWDEGEVKNEIAWHTRGSSGVALHWQPNRFGEGPVAESGTFERDN